MTNINNIDFSFNITKCQDMLQGSSDHVLGLFDNNIILIGGFSCGLNTTQVPKPFKNKTNSKTSHKRGFIDNIFCYSTKNDSWKTIGKIPIHPRQGCKSIVVGNKMYIWGGFSYTPLTKTEIEYYSSKNIYLPGKKDIYSYVDGCCLSYDNNVLQWHECPNLPLPLVEYGLVNYKIQKKLFFLNGCLYDHHSFNTHIVPSACSIGKIFFSMSYDDKNNIIPNSTNYINNFPGSPRCYANTHIIDDFIYVIGGINTTSSMNKFKGYNEYTYNNVIDNWKYNIKDNSWERLSNNLIPMSNQGSAVYKDRYIILYGGTKYNTTCIENNKIINTKELEKSSILPYNNVSTIKNQWITQEDTANQYNWYFSNIIMVYDTFNNKFSIAKDKLPINISTPEVISNKDTTYIIGGEGNPLILDDMLQFTEGDINLVDDGTYYGNALSLILKINIA